MQRIKYGNHVEQQSQPLHVEKQLPQIPRKSFHHLTSLAAPSSTSESAKRPNTKAATNSLRRYGARKGVNQTRSRMA